MPRFQEERSPFGKKIREIYLSGVVRLPYLCKHCPHLGGSSPAQPGSRQLQQTISQDAPVAPQKILRKSDREGKEGSPCKIASRRVCVVQTKNKQHWCAPMLNWARSFLMKMGMQVPSYQGDYPLTMSAPHPRAYLRRRYWRKELILGLPM